MATCRSKRRREDETAHHILTVSIDDWIWPAQRSTDKVDLSSRSLAAAISRAS